MWVRLQTEQFPQELSVRHSGLAGIYMLKNHIKSFCYGRSEGFPPGGNDNHRVSFVCVKKELNKLRGFRMVKSPSTPSHSYKSGIK
jgi:hypothetical protein